MPSNTSEMMMMKYVFKKALPVLPVAIALAGTLLLQQNIAYAADLAKLERIDFEASPTATDITLFAENPSLTYRQVSASENKLVIDIDQVTNETTVQTHFHSTSDENTISSVILQPLSDHSLRLIVRGDHLATPKLAFHTSRPLAPESAATPSHPKIHTNGVTAASAANPPLISEDFSDVKSAGMDAGTDSAKQAPAEKKAAPVVHQAPPKAASPNAITDSRAIDTGTPLNALDIRKPADPMANITNTMQAWHVAEIAQYGLMALMLVGLGWFIRRKLNTLAKAQEQGQLDALLQQQFQGKRVGFREMAEAYRADAYNTTEAYRADAYNTTEAYRADAYNTTEVYRADAYGSEASGTVAREALENDQYADALAEQAEGRFYNPQPQPIQAGRQKQKTDNKQKPKPGSLIGLRSLSQQVDDLYQQTQAQAPTLPAFPASAPVARPASPQNFKPARPDLRPEIRSEAPARPQQAALPAIPAAKAAPKQVANQYAQQQKRPAIQSQPAQSAQPVNRKRKISDDVLRQELNRAADLKNQTARKAPSPAALFNATLNASQAAGGMKPQAAAGAKAPAVNRQRAGQNPNAVSGGNPEVLNFLRDVAELMEKDGKPGIARSIQKGLRP